MVDLNFIISPDYIGYYIARSVFLSISTLLIIGIGYLLFATGYLKMRWLESLVTFFFERPYGASGILQKWRQINRYAESDSVSKQKLAVMEAENLLDKTLKRLGYEGDNIEERLEQVPKGKIGNLNEIKIAHELRNDIAYDPDYQLQKEEVKEALGIYEKALQDLEVI
ncbi:MAG: hypothetical protein V5A57_01755 [Candidatus Paceibacterota bacterium]